MNGIPRHIVVVAALYRRKDVKRNLAASISVDGNGKFQARNLVIEEHVHGASYR